MEDSAEDRISYGRLFPNNVSKLCGDSLWILCVAVRQFAVSLLRGGILEWRLYGILDVGLVSHSPTSLSLPLHKVSQALHPNAFHE